ncbi:hypothetical protein C8T65DRAFT_744209 [Cerioporus squamosus]|nr:hypothetical protein C8T65DRAFT_744209 [Cerioporus squamosus]
MHPGSSDIGDPPNPPISNGAVGLGCHWVYDEVAGRWLPIIAPSVVGLRIASIPNPPLPFLGTPPPLPCHCNDIRNHNVASASHANNTGMLSSVPQAGHTRPAEASGSFQVTQPLAQNFPISKTRQGVVYKELYQTIYDRGLTSEAFRLPEMLFQGIGLGAALRNDFHGLADSNRGAWPANSSFEVPQKLAIVFCFPGYAKYSRQVNVLRCVRTRPLPQTRSKLAHIIAEEMQTFLTLAHSSGKPLVHSGRQLGLDDLVLLDIQHISRGSLQPTIGVVVPNHPDATIPR